MRSVIEKKSEDKLCFYHTKPLGLLMKRTVLVTGITGAGKSSITNVLVNQGVCYHQMCRPAVTDDSRALVTSKLKLYYNGDLTIIDSPGLYALDQDSKFDSGEAIKQFILQLNSGISTILIVEKAGRALKATLQMESLMKTLFGPFFSTHCVLVLTHCNDSVEVHKQRNSKDTAYLEYLNSFSDVITVNFEKHVNEVMDKAAIQVYREPALKALMAVIHARTKKLYVRPGLFGRLSLLVTSAFTKDLTLAQKTAELTKTEQFYVGGLCVICDEELLGDKYLMPCGHVYHFDCFTSWHMTKLEQRQSTTCPQCRAEFTEISSGVRETDRDETQTRQLLTEMCAEGSFEVNVVMCPTFNLADASSSQVRTQARTILITVQSSFTIQQMKVLVRHQSGVNVDDQGTMLFAGNVLQDDRTLQSQGITEAKPPMRLTLFPARSPAPLPPKKFMCFR